MSRNLSSNALASMYAQETSEVWLVLLEIDEAGLSEPIRVVNNNENVTHNGNVYEGFPFELPMPDEVENQVTSVTLTIDNVDRRIVQAVRSLSSPPTVTMSVVMASSPDTIEAGPFEMTLKDATYTALTVVGRLGFEDFEDEPFPGETFTPQNHPGLF